MADKEKIINTRPMVTLIKTPPSYNLMVPIVLIAMILTGLMFYAFKIDTVETVKGNGELTLRKTSKIVASSGGIVSDAPVEIGGKVLARTKVAAIKGRDEVISDLAGVLIYRYFEKGTVVNPGDTLALIGDTDSGWIVRANVDSEGSTKIKPGYKVIITFPSAPELGAVEGTLGNALSNSSQEAHKTTAFAVTITPTDRLKRWQEKNGILIYGINAHVRVITNSVPFGKKLLKLLLKN